MDSTEILNSFSVTFAGHGLSVVVLYDLPGDIGNLNKS